MVAFNYSYTEDKVIVISEIRIQRRMEIFSKIEETILVQDIMIDSNDSNDSDANSIFVY